MVKEAAPGSLPNVNENAKPVQRLSAFESIIDAVLTQVQEPTPRWPTARSFLVRMAWHEGQSLTKRIQDPPSPTRPGRSFFQFEPTRGYDSILHAKKSKSPHFPTIVALSGQTEKALLDAAERLKAHCLNVNKLTWPDNCLLERLLGSPTEARDHYAAMLTRVELLRHSTSIPGVRNVKDQATYWADYWWLGKSSERDERLAKFKANSTSLAQLDSEYDFDPYTLSAENPAP